MALWVLMHDIDLVFHKQEQKSDYPKGILPHYFLRNKDCPGSNFPYLKFRNRLSIYVHIWQSDVEFKKALEEFKELPMIMPKNQ